MTVRELQKVLDAYIKRGHSDTRVIAYAYFTLPWDCKKGEEVDYPLLHLNDVYYQSGDIELHFSDREVE